MRDKMPKSVLFGGPAAVFGYYLVMWLLENDPDHWLIRGLTRVAGLVRAAIDAAKKPDRETG